MCCTMVLGLLSRQYPHLFPAFIAQYAGDTLWALAAFLGIGFLLPRWSTLSVAGLALLFSYAIEISQLYQEPWINQIRHTLLGGLILGYGFLWSDLICYTIGVGLGAAVELVCIHHSRR
ncbi:MAG: DUF2809 domain-containing protein [Planctomycetes bacterium]|nr:DUF2809 domain-containing protein [Planctomycetota bacterium]